MAAKKSPPAKYEQVLAEHRARLDRILDRRGAARLKDVYQSAAEAQARKVARSIGAKHAPFTIQGQQLALAQLKQGQAMLARRMAGELGDLTAEAQQEALGSLADDLRALDSTLAGAPLPIEEVARFQGIVGDQRSILRKMHEEGAASYSAAVVGAVEAALSKTLLQGGTTGEAIDAVMEVQDSEWWRAERIVRTETAFAYNAARADGIEEMTEVLPDIMQRWTELVSDDGQPMDDRVGKDSVALHGQVSEPGGRFVMPEDAEDETEEGQGKIAEDMLGRSWLHPPNRPNDRAVILPWRREWGIPGWLYEDGEKKWLVPA